MAERSAFRVSHSALKVALMSALLIHPLYGFYSSLDRFALDPSKVAAAYDVNDKLNDLPLSSSFAHAMAPGESLRIVINAASCKMNVIAAGPVGEHVVAVYDVAVGSPEHESPVLRGAIQRIEWNPDWIPPHSFWARNEHYKPPGPQNPLGKVRMNIFEDYYVHGTTNEKSIGLQASHGCVRMRRTDVVGLAMTLQDLYGIDKDNVDIINTWRPETVRLSRAIPVSLIYNLVSIVDTHLVIFADSYKNSPDLLKLVNESLLKNNWLVSFIDQDKLKNILAAGTGKRLDIDIDGLFLPDKPHRFITTTADDFLPYTWVSNLD